MRNAGLDELQAGIKIDRRNINNYSESRKLRGTGESIDEGEGGE